MRRKDPDAIHCPVRSLLCAATAASAQTQKTIPAPPDVTAPPADAAKTSVGARVEGAQARHRQDTSRRDRPRDRPLHGLDDRRKDVRQLRRAANPATFPLDRVIAGWTEGVQLMVTGETRRFWIPEAAGLPAASATRAGCSCSTSSCSRSPRRRPGAGRRQGAAGRREEDAERPRLQGADPGHRHAKTHALEARSRCTTRAGRPTARCSTARSRAASRRRFRSTA